MIIPVSKWLITMVSKSPKWGCSPSKWLKWLINGGYQPLTNWDDPPSTLGWWFGYSKKFLVKGIVSWGVRSPRIPNHRAPNHQFTLEMFRKRSVLLNTLEV